MDVDNMRLLLAFLCLGTAAPSGLLAHLAVENAIVDLSSTDAAFALNFTVSNPTQEPIRLLKREIPLEGVLSNMFLIRNLAGEVMGYRGKDLKRTEQPGAHEYVWIPPLGSSSHRIRIGGRYQLSGDGEYSVTMRPLHDDRLDYSGIAVVVTVFGTDAYEARYLEAMQRRSEAKQTLRRMRRTQTITTDGCSSSQIAELTNWHNDAIDKIVASKACTESSCATLVDTWFGPATTQAELSSSVTSVFDRMGLNIGNSIYKCEAASHCAGGSTFAYVYPSDSTQTIYMCQFTFNYPDYAEKVQTVIHELSHFTVIGDTNDNAYGQQTCYNLAQNSPNLARMTADNFGYFAIFTNACYRYQPLYTANTPPCSQCSVSPSTTSANVCGASPAPTVAVPTTAPTSVDSCTYAHDGVCDEPTYCAYGTDATDCAVGTTPAPTPQRHYAQFQVAVAGISSGDFGWAAHNAFKTLVAANAGTVCGILGIHTCTMHDVTITSHFRRTTTVNYQLGLYSASAASSVQTALNTYTSSGSLATGLANSGASGLSGVTSVTTVSSSISVDSSSSSSSSNNMTIILIIACGALLLLLIIVVILCCFCRDSKPPAQAAEQAVGISLHPQNYAVQQEHFHRPQPQPIPLPVQQYHYEHPQLPPPPPPPFAVQYDQQAQLAPLPYVVQDSQQFNTLAPIKGACANQRGL